MGFFARLFRAAPKDHLRGASLGAERAWSITRITDPGTFVQALPRLVPPGSILYLEGVYSDEIIDYLRQHTAEHTLKIAGGTIWPKPQCFHLPITDQTALDLARVSQGHVAPEICAHLHIYRDDQVLASWYDAFSDPLRISTSIPENQIQDFCRDLQCTYELEPVA
jgi:hypothetical protein